MPRPTKRVVASRQSVRSRILGKRQRLSDSEVSDTLLDSDSPSDPEEQTAVSEAEDSESESESEGEQDQALPIAQPVGGWKATERTLQGYSKTNARKTKQSRYYYNKKEKEKERKRKELQQTYGAASIHLRNLNVRCMWLLIL